MGTIVGDDFQKATKHIRGKSLGGNLNWSYKPEIYKHYPSSKTIQLPRQMQDKRARIKKATR